MLFWVGAIAKKDLERHFVLDCALRRATCTPRHLVRQRNSRKLLRKLTVILRADSKETTLLATTYTAYVFTLSSLPSEVLRQAPAHKPLDN